MYGTIFGATQHEVTYMADAKSGRQTITIPEAGLALGISRNAAYDAAKRGEIPTIKIGRLLLVPKAALDRMLSGEKAA
jgi:excisionase family DNA binding protein